VSAVRSMLVLVMLMEVVMVGSTEDHHSMWAMRTMGAVEVRRHTSMVHHHQSVRPEVMHCLCHHVGVEAALEHRRWRGWEHRMVAMHSRVVSGAVELIVEVAVNIVVHVEAVVHGSCFWHAVGASVRLAVGLGIRCGVGSRCAGHGIGLAIPAWR